MSTSIEWTNEVWNPLAGCSPVSDGCRNCYAAKEAIRLQGNPNPKIAGKYAGTAAMRGVGSDRRAVFTGVVNLHAGSIEEPLRWRKPRRVFVNSMSDLFHEKVPFEFIDKVFAVMALAGEHTFQVLTKRAGADGGVRQHPREDQSDRADAERVFVAVRRLRVRSPVAHSERMARDIGGEPGDRRRADHHLLRTPAAVRFLSCEPLLGPLDLGTSLYPDDPSGGDGPYPSIDWVIVGGESGGHARGFNIRWARSIVAQCRAAAVPVFVKQLGAHPFDTEASAKLDLADRKGGHWHEWPEDLRVREFPAVIS